jgi:hypothetical protein
MHNSSSGPSQKTGIECNTRQHTKVALDNARKIKPEALPKGTIEPEPCSDEGLMLSGGMLSGQHRDGISWRHFDEAEADNQRPDQQWNGEQGPTPGVLGQRGNSGEMSRLDQPEIGISRTRMS